MYFLLFKKNNKNIGFHFISTIATHTHFSWGISLISSSFGIGYMNMHCEFELISFVPSELDFIRVVIISLWVLGGFHVLLHVDGTSRVAHYCTEWMAEWWCEYVVRIWLNVWKDYKELKTRRRNIRFEAYL